MHYTGVLYPGLRLEWCGVMGDHGGYNTLLVEDVPLTLSTGGIVPANWHGKRVRITVELLDGEKDTE